MCLNEKPKVCPCEECVVARKFYRLTAKLPEKDRDWLRDFHDGCNRAYAIDLALLRAYCAC